jgi:hypothetical protein
MAKKGESSEQDVSLKLLKQKLFVDEFFNPNLHMGDGTVIAKNWKQYDVKNNMESEAFLSETF